MENSMHTEKIGKYTIDIHQDCDYPFNPREDWDNFGHMICFHRGYALGDKHNYSVDDIKDIISQDDIISLPLYLYDHSGITMNTSGFSCRWDSGQVGYIFVSKEEIRKVFDAKRITKKTLEKTYELLENEVKEYDHYLTGNCWYYTITDKTGEVVDSCGGFLGDYNYCLDEAKICTKWSIENDIKEHCKKVKAWIKNAVPLDKRTPLSI